MISFDPKPRDTEVPVENVSSLPVGLGDERPELGCDISEAEPFPVDLDWEFVQLLLLWTGVLQHY